MTAEEYGYGTTPSSPITVRRGSPFRSAQDDGHGDAALSLACPTSVLAAAAVEALLVSLPNLQVSHDGTTAPPQDNTMMTEVVPAPMSRRSSLRQEGSSRRNSMNHDKGELVEITLPPNKVGEGQRLVVRRTSLTFQEPAEFTTIEPAQSMTCKEDLWFQQSEIKLIRKQAKAIVEKTDNGFDAESGKKYCTRGLEKLMQPQTTHRQRDNAWDAVLNEQILQKKLGVFKEEAMANLYIFSTIDSRNEAMIRAREDAQDAARYLSRRRSM